MQIGMEPLVIDWAKEELWMAQIIRHMYLYANNSIFKSIGRSTITYYAITCFLESS